MSNDLWICLVLCTVAHSVVYADGTSTSRPARSTAPFALFNPSAETRKKIQTDPAYEILLKCAAQTLQAEPIDPRGEYGSYKGAYAKTNVAFWPRVVGIPLVQWMENLGYAYLLTGEQKYADQGVRLLTQTCRDFPVTFEKIQKGMPGARGHITYGIALGCIFFGKQLTPEQLALVEGTAAGYVDDCLEFFGNPESGVYLTANHTALNGAPAGIVSLYFIDRPGFAERLEKVVALQEGWLNHAFDSKGLYLEGHGYARYGMAPRLLILAWLLREHDGRDLFKNSHLKKFPYALIEKLIPGTNQLDTRGDNDYTSAGLECLFLAVANRDPAAMWLWENSDRSFRNFPLDLLVEAQNAPEAQIDFSQYPLSEFFPVRQLALWRTGWSRDDVLFSIEAGPYGRAPNGRSGTHAQSDKGHFCLYAFGEMWAMDSGYANDAGNPLSRSHSFAHNLVLIDGQGEMVRRVDAQIETYFDSPEYGFSRADLTSAYNENDRHKMRNPPVQRVKRQALFARPGGGVPAYAAVFDDVQPGAGEHTFSWMLMAPTDKRITLRDDGALLATVDAPDAFLTSPPDRPDGSATWKFQVDRPSKYSFWIRCAAGGASVPHSDSVWLSLDGGADVRWDFGVLKNFSWLLLSRSSDPKSLSPVPLEAVEFALEPGEHTLTLKTREKEAQVAEVYCSPDGSAPFTPGPCGRFLKVGEAELTPGMERIRNNAAALVDSRCLVALDAAGQLTFSKDTYSPPNPRPPQHIQRVRADVTALNPYFVALLIPLRGKTPEPKIAFVRRAAGVTVTIEWPGAVDTIAWEINADGTVNDAVFNRHSK